MASSSTSSPPAKRRRINLPDAYQATSFYTLRILENSEDKIIELSDRDFSCEPTSGLPLEEMVSEPYFQDNTPAFKFLLSKKTFVIIIFPPGSGKTTFARLFEAYLSSVIRWSEKLQTFFDKCELTSSSSSETNENYAMFKKSCNVAYINFEEIQGNTPECFEQSLISIMLRAFILYAGNAAYVKEETKLERNPELVYSSLHRFVNALYDSNKTTFILLDSCDTAYNLIALMGTDASDICKSFTMFIQKAQMLSDTNLRMRIICFGVSPYFALEFNAKATIYNIREKNEFGQYFSYSEKTIKHVIEQWSLKTTLDKCKELAKFNYGDNHFVNPALCVSYLRSLHNKEEFFHVDVIPRSLWLTSIFTFDDLNLLFDMIKRTTCEVEFPRGVSIMDLAGENASRKLFYPLFVFGGYLSCIPQHGSNKCTLNCSNEITRCVLEKIVNDIYISAYKRDIEECSAVYKIINSKQWQKLCDLMSGMLSNASDKAFSREKDYNNWLFGLLCTAKADQTSSAKITIENNVSLSDLYPDLTVFGTPEAAAIWELKHLKSKDTRTKFADEVPLREYPVRSNIDGAQINTLMKDIKREFVQAKLQMAQYASMYVEKHQYNSVKCFITVFYGNHVVLFVCDYHKVPDSDVSSTPWKAYSSSRFLTPENLTTMMSQ